MKKSILLLSILFARICIASPYPVITSLEAIQNPRYSESWTYKFTQGVVDIGPTGDTVVPHGWWVLFGHRHHATNGTFNIVAERKALVHDGETYSEAGMRLYENAKSITQIHHGGDLIGECVAYVFAPTDSEKDDTRTIYPGGCMDIPPVDNFCEFSTPEINLDHGSLSVSDAEGSVASAPLDVACTADTSVKFSLETRQDYIYLQPTGKAAITVNDKPLNSQITLPSGPSTVMVKDMLSGVTAEGVNSGSSVIIMEPY